MRISEHRLFFEEIRDILNKYGIDNACDTPDYILADYMCECLTAFEKMAERRAASVKGE